MSKTNNRLALIAALCAGGAVGSLVASEHEVKEEVSLAAKHNDDNSTLDEGENVEIISPLLAERVGEVGDKFGAEELSLTAAERKEIGKPLVRFKAAQNLLSEDDAEFLAWKKEMGYL